jgi:hypothetical protein
MTGTGTEGLGLTGTLRLTWVTDDLAHVIDTCTADDTGRHRHHAPTRQRVHQPQPARGLSSRNGPAGTRPFGESSCEPVTIQGYVRDAGLMVRTVSSWHRP